MNQTSVRRMLFFPENIKPFGEGGRLNLVEEPGELCPGVSLRICYGHTPGMIIPVIYYRGRTWVTCR
jgi:hypothetical protein